ncbi:CHAP domain-containing protein [Candidatus Saccharibacteria bacterium]|nr:CHAP domain-containing protein [Candidatus Saccharibacteria bacterium]
MQRMKQFKFLFATLLFVFSFVIIPTCQAVMDYSKYSAYNISYYNPCGGSSGGGGGGSGTSILDGVSIPVTHGGTAYESQYDESGGPKGNFVSVASGNTYWINMRWDYVAASWTASFSTTSSSGKQATTKASWFKKQPRIVVITNPKNSKSVRAIVGDYGPAPWTGTKEGKDSTPSYWNGKFFDSEVIPNNPYDGRVSGLSKAAMDALGGTDIQWTHGGSDNGGSGVDLQYAWSNDQTSPAGPTDEVAGSGTGSSTNQAMASGVSVKDGWVSGIPGLDSTSERIQSEYQGAKLENAHAIILHSTEGTSVGKAAYGADRTQFAAHFIVDLKKKVGYQNISLDEKSGATKAADDGTVQIEIVGFSSGNKDYSLSKFGDAEWDYLAQYLNAISSIKGIPLTTSLNWQNPTRLSASAFTTYSGIMGHMHAPSPDDHTDPGNIWDQVSAAIKRNPGGSISNNCSPDGSNLSGSVLQAAMEIGSWDNNKQTYSQSSPCFTASMIDECLKNHFEGKYTIDCSGLVSAILYKASGKYIHYTTATLSKLPDGFQKIEKNGDVQPGDIFLWLGGSQDHTGVVTAVSGGGKYTVMDTGGSQNGGNFGFETRSDSIISYFLRFVGYSS